MGNAASKTRKLPTARAINARPTPSWAGARTGDGGQPHLRASGSKNADITADAGDPHLLSNLRALGPVTITSRTTAGTNARVADVLQKQAESESDAQLTRPGRNKLHAETLAALLDELREIGWHPARAQEIAALAERYNIDLDVLTGLRGVLNTPSIGPAIRKTGVSMTAVWIEESHLAKPQNANLPLSPQPEPQTPTKSKH
ncbi:hypothetical protein BKA62DRAFT_40968 [Auriculariales sp. MPI-PUGE-AT-0066]|nr:hypothetical protein BKA62DRAFT_40968 [Auriculariales sp. MPI-PUGE-AT-0066]